MAKLKGKPFMTYSSVIYSEVYQWSKVANHTSYFWGYRRAAHSPKRACHQNEGSDANCLAKKITRFPKGKTGPLGKLAETSQHCTETKTKTPARKRHLCNQQLLSLSESLELCFLFYKKGSQQRLSCRTDKWRKNEPRQWGPVAEFLASRTPYFSW